MNASTIKTRLLKVEDFEAVVRIDEKVLNASRRDYYRVKFEASVQSPDHLPVSLVAEEADGTVVGFIMGNLFIGEYGISQDRATLDTIGVDPDHQHKGIGKQLITEFMDHLKALGVQKVSTLVDSNDTKMTHFFSANQFGPSPIVNLERSLSRN
jgi:ribosomal protein S18 acetylase RimI-like enzyme